MQNRSRAGQALLALVAAAALGTPAAQLAARPAGTQVVIEVTNLRNADGVVRACMTRDSARFPRCQDASQGYRTMVPAGQATTLRFTNVQPGTYAIALLHDENDNGKADRVLVDAPCSGTGTWRRNPESRWRLTQRELDKLTQLQGRLLGIAAELVRTGGKLTYVTCSLLDEEGAGQIDAFLAANPEWQAVPPDLPAGEPRGAGIRLSPSRDGTDGFFIACLSKP